MATKLPDVGSVNGLGDDPWGESIRYKFLDSAKFQVISDGRAKSRSMNGTRASNMRSRRSDQTRPLAGEAQAGAERPGDETSIGTNYKASAFSGGQTKLEGAAYLSLLHLGHALHGGHLYPVFDGLSSKELPQ